MKSIAIFFAASFISLVAIGAETINVPVGVEPKNWIALTENLGFVVTGTAEVASPRVLGSQGQLLLNEVSPQPAASGYFMIKSAQGWRRLVVMTPADIALAAKR